MDIQRIQTLPASSQGVQRMDAGEGAGSPDRFLSLLGPLGAGQQKPKNKRSGAKDLPSQPKPGPSLAQPILQPLYPDEASLEPEAPGKTIDAKA